MLILNYNFFECLKKFCVVMVREGSRIDHRYPYTVILITTTIIRDQLQLPTFS